MNLINKKSNLSDAETRKKLSDISSRIWGKKPARIIIKIMAGVLAFVLLASLIFSLPALSDFRNCMIRKVAESTVLMHKAKALKTDVKELAGAIKAQNISKAYTAREKMQKDADFIRETLNKPIWNAANLLPSVKRELNDAKALLDILDDADRTIIGSLLPLMEKYPVSEFKTGSGVNDAALLGYLRFFEAALPEAKDLAIRMQPLDLSRFDSGGSLKKLTDSMDEIIAILDLAEEADGSVIAPLIPLLEKYPFSELKTDSGTNDDALFEYLKFFEDVLPELKSLSYRFRSLDLSKLETNETVAGVTGKMDDIIALLDIAEYADSKIIAPLMKVMEQCPFSELKSDDGFNIRFVLKYLDLFEEVMPAANELSVRIKAQDLSALMRQETLEKYLAKMDRYIDLGNDAFSHLPVFRGIIGDGSDRLYVLAAQQNSEMRAAGGFPGQIASISIKDGMLTISRFRAARRVLPDYVKGLTITSNEIKIFTEVFIHPRDASYCPDFERVAYIWNTNYLYGSTPRPEGVISVTPVMIQKLLSFLGSIELSDGTVLNGENVLRFLAHDLYYNYFRTDLGYTSHEADIITNKLYYETADKVFDLVMSGLKISNLSEYYSAFIEGINDRSIQIWMEDENVQQLIRDEGWNSGLNNDPDRPEIAVFFNSTGGAKDTWFLDVDTELSDPVVNSDGTRTYSFKATFTNTMPNEEKELASKWITGKYDGMLGYILLFAPSGGKISDFHMKPFRRVDQYTYEGLDLRCTIPVRIMTSTPIVIKCKITTAPGVETVPTVRIPVVMTDYR